MPRHPHAASRRANTKSIPQALAIVALGIWFWCASPPDANCQPSPPVKSLRVSPPHVELNRPEASQQLVVEAVEAVAPKAIGEPGVTPPAQGVTRESHFMSTDPSIARVDEHGQVRPIGDGRAEIVVEWHGGRATVAVEVKNLKHPPAVSFRHEVLPILTKAGCNSGGCHGKAEGQNGFKLSIFGFDAESDHAALVKEARGRRVVTAAPSHSLLLRKGLADVPHGGGQKLQPGGAWHRLVHRWIAEGATFDTPSASPIKALLVEPAELTLSFHQHRQLRVTAVNEAGERRCVTSEAEFQSNAESVAGVEHDGLIITKDAPGEAAILVRYMGHVATCRVTLPQPASEFQFSRPPENNFVDSHVWNKLQAMAIQPSGDATDGEFLRRVYLDTIGRLPSVPEARRFLEDPAADKRDQLIDHLLDRPEYADYWAMRWADILRVDKSIVTPQGAVGMTRWLRRQFSENTRYDSFVRDIILARGNTLAESPASFYQVHDDPEMLARSVGQVFLGVRIECAQCHHHPFERWGQDDYFAFAGFFTGIQRKKFGGGMKIIPGSGEPLKHPRSGEAMPTAGLGAAPASFDAESDRRLALAEWMTAPSNPFLARMIVNRLWSHYFDRGLVEPIDDIRETNPATNEPLLDALAKYLVDQQFDLKALTRAILRSRAYQRSSQANPENEMDAQNYSHAAWKSLPAEVLLDAICDATEVSQEFNGWPVGVRAIEVWDNRMPSYFFQVFGRPQRVSVCECERGDSPSIAQALHLMNAPETVAKIRHRDGRVARLAASTLTPREMIEELYLATLSRYPRAQEVQLMLQAFEADDAGDRREAAEDVLWALLNAKEFVFNH